MSNRFRDMNQFYMNEIILFSNQYILKSSFTLSNSSGNKDISIQKNQKTLIFHVFVLYFILILITVHQKMTNIFYSMFKI